MMRPRLSNRDTAARYIEGLQPWELATVQGRSIRFVATAINKALTTAIRRAKRDAKETNPTPSPTPDESNP